jgi:hypothetical protein
VKDILGKHMSTIFGGYDEMRIKQRDAVRMSAVCFLLGLYFHRFGFGLKGIFPYYRHENKVICIQKGQAS